MILQKRAKLINARNAAGKSQEELAKQLNMSLSMYSYIEQGRRNPSDDTKEKIARYFGLTVGYLFFDESITDSNKITQM